MTNLIKSNIRLRKVAQRLSKDVMPKNFNPLQRKIVKTNEKIDSLSKYNISLWKEAYEKGFKPNRDNNNPAFFEILDAINTNNKQI